MRSFPLSNKGKIALGVTLALVLSALTMGILGAVLSAPYPSDTVSNALWVKGIRIGIYWNVACTNRASSINWGIIDPGSNKTVTVYIRNEGRAAATLSEAVQNWNPSTVSSYVTLDWNYSGQTLRVNQVVPIKLTLAVLPTVSGITNFSFDATITAIS
jgi:hypothetical protein